VTVRTLTVTAPADSAPTRRLDFLDALRGVAVALVLVQHVGERLFPAVRELSASGIQFGQFGVTVFFLCSGFIIPASLERGGGSRWAALRAFWISRVFRLYPLYWLSLAGAGLLVVADRYAPEQPLTGSDWLANVSMLQMLAGSPHALGLYWTLGFEMLFYLGVSVLFLLGWHRRSGVLSLAASGCCLATAALSGPLAVSAPLGAFCLATMFTGTVLHRWHSGTLGLPTVAGCVGAVLVSGGVLLAAHTDTAPASEPGFAPMLAAWLAAYAVFGAGMALRRRTPPAWLRRLGRISFSVYLMQALVLAAVPALPSPYLTAVLWVTATVALSEATFRLVERPAIGLGRSLTRRIPDGPAPTRKPAPPVSGPVRPAQAGDPVAA
jgi:peptidoglycan/LPS O-acetylase OafA/YrhL